MTAEMRDERLREALRHAPDAQLGPAPALSEAILAEARAKAKGGRAARRPPAASWWQRLTQPAVASALAGVMVATVVGLMWWEQPMDEALPRRAEPAAVSAPPAAPPIAPPRVEAPQPPPRAANDAARPAAPKVKTVPAPARAAAPTPTPADKAVLADTAPAAAPPPAPVAPPPVVEAMRDADTAGLAKAQQGGAAQRASSKVAESETKRAEAGFLAAAEPRPRRDAFSPAGLASLRAAIAAEPARWSWQRDGDAAPLPMNDAMQNWLSQLDAATASAWHAGAPDAQSTGRRVLLLRDGRLLHSLQIGERDIRWQGSADNSARQADVPGAALQSALETLAH